MKGKETREGRNERRNKFKKKRGQRRKGRKEK